MRATFSTESHTPPADYSARRTISLEKRPGMAKRIEPNECELEVAAFIAARNWERWRCCYEAPAEELPICEDPELFRKFVKEYGLLRGVKMKDQERLRIWMTKNGRLTMLTEKEDGSGVECLLDKMQGSGFMRHRSFLSKLAAFSRPDVFIACDSFARQGLVNLGIEKKQPANYCVYLEAVRKLQCQIRKDIEKHLKGRTIPTGNAEAFQLRVLDVYLMISGEREIPTTSYELLLSMKRNPSGWRLF